MNRYLGYKLLPGADRERDPERSLNKEKAIAHCDKLKIFSILGTILAILAFVSVCLRLIAAESPRPPRHPPFLTLCGSTRAEALSNNCKFDVLSFAWMPPACHDPELCEEFCSVREWEWFLDENLTQSVSRTEVEEGRVEKVYTPKEYEELQCLFSWRKVHRAVLKGAPVDGFSGDKGYSEYCGVLLVERIGRPTEDSVHADNTARQAFLTELKFPHCGVEYFGRHYSH
ncbi:uncharacterized protein Z519_01178 [Cladophialophora bantiana CBS 173.52]|uniref:Uncharacterized protein n=1 Tax=Cladophialophora bantiana (strain ATCC 10958 / CBS 173.52 / CDC B-1940 / NIH 8579) TaxID=1442370 RepID=A0A0D2ILD1_CLAB1|nr:uncharacterized protein Z519_01178 [Cladophialophora bantiana CBS 173.52]KIW97594.1 hypothetical protein Z519_01178 [Cladophialophora bantiana CBS 173.52]